MKRLLSLSLFLMTAMLSFAFEVDGIYYNITSSSSLTVAVTYRGTSYSQYSNEYTGDVTIPESVSYGGKTYSVTSIGSYAFKGCSGLTSVTIGNSVTTIGKDAFSNCSGLTSITIPNSVTSIGYEAFYGCSGLKKVIVPDIAAWCNISFGDFFANPLYYAKHIYSDENTEITDLVIPNSVTTIGSYAFYGCSGLTSIVVENGNTKYDSRDNCNAIIETASNTLILGCKTTVIPNSVTSIGSYAFWNCSGLTSITIPNSVTAIGSSAFSNCSSLTSVTIGNSVTSIGNYAFRYCSSLTSIEIPNSVTSIGDGAFSGCSGLTSVTIPNSVTSIGYDLFVGCSGLTKVIVPDIAAWCNISFGNYYANPLFYAKHIFSDENTEITDLVIPNSVTSIGYSAFYNCSSLTSVTIPNSVTSIGDWTFNKCSGLTSVTIGNSVTSIGDYAFASCSGLTSIEIPSSVTSIGSYAFYGCSGLTSVTIPGSVTSIGSYAFDGCSGMKEIISYINKPFYIYSNCWGGVDKSIPLYVPAGTKEKYQSANYWKDFTNIIEFGGERIEPATEPKEVDMAAVPDQMDLNGMVVGNTYYVLDADNGDGADGDDGCVVINTTTTDEAVDGIAGKDVSDASVKAAFKGFIFMVPAGTGTISINAETLGTSSLKVKSGSQAAQAFQLAERETVEIPYSVAEPTYVYIYAGTGTQAARSVGAARAAAAENSVKVYSYKWEPAEPTGISSVDNSQSATGNEAGDWYTIDGRKLSGKPVQKGIYIVNGHKVAVK